MEGMHGNTRANRSKLTPEQRAALDVAVARLEALGGDLVEHLRDHLSPEEFDALVPPEQWAARQRAKTHMTAVAHEQSFSVNTTANQERSN
jgi:hypothetical protein